MRESEDGGYPWVQCNGDRRDALPAVILGSLKRILMARRAEDLSRECPSRRRELFVRAGADLAGEQKVTSGDRPCFEA